MVLIGMDDVTRQWIEKVASNAYWDGLFAHADTLFLILFVLAALALIASCFVARHSDKKVSLRMIGSIGLLLLLAVTQQSLLDSQRGFIADQNKRYEAKIRELTRTHDKEAVLQTEYLYVPQGNSLVYMSLGNTGLAADYMWLTSLQYVTSSFRRGQKFEMLVRFYETMIDLDPHWTEAQVNAGRVLSALEPDRYKVERFYMRAIQKNPDSWKLCFEAGRLFIVPPPTQKLKKDFAARATYWFGRTRDKLARLPDAATNPRIQGNIKQAERYISQMTLDTGQTEASDTMLWEMTTNKENPIALRYSAAQDWVTARSLLIESKLKEQVEKIKKESGRYPPSLEPVFAALAGDKRITPVDPFGYRFAYNPNTGEVRSQGVLARATVQAAVVVSALVAEFKNKVGRNPKDLNEVQVFVKKLYEPPAEGAPAAVTNWIGEELNVLTTPLGKPWKYDAEKGEVEPPVAIDPQLLPKSVRRYFPDLWD